MKTINIINSSLQAQVDDNDFALVSQYTWHLVKGRKTFYAEAGSGTGNYRFMMHELILGKVNGLEIDHKDTNGLNNQRQNIRHLTRSENAMNRRAPSTNKSGYKGVYFKKDKKKWAAQITKDYRIIHIGYFPTPEKAACAYNEEALKLYGNVAQLNLVPVEPRPPTEVDLSQTESLAPPPSL